jgi:hypothetical protein
MAEKPKGPPLPFPLGEREGAQTEKTKLEMLKERSEQLRKEIDQSEALLRIAMANQVDFARASAWFAEHWPEPRICPICKQATWGMAPTFAQVPVSQLGLHMPPRTNPCVAVACRTCGNTLFFNAIIMGLLPKGED